MTNNNQEIFEEKILEVKRVTKIVKGGKILTFRVLVVIGNKNKKIGIGIGRGEDVNIATEKAILNAKKHLLFVPLNLNYSIEQIVEAKYCASHILLKPSKSGSGLSAGGATRTILELAGFKNIVAKQLGSNSLLNNAKATIKALSLLMKKLEINSNRLFTNSNIYKII